MQCNNCIYFGKAADAPDSVEKDCMWGLLEDKPCEKKKYNEQILKLEVTYIKNTKTIDEIKELLNADKIDLISEQIFEHERDMLPGDYMDEMIKENE